MNFVGNTTKGATSGETGYPGADGFTISGKRTEEEQSVEVIQS